jgi:hypothetical protein
MRSAGLRALLCVLDGSVGSAQYQSHVTPDVVEMRKPLDGKGELASDLHSTR